MLEKIVDISFNTNFARKKHSRSFYGGKKGAENYKIDNGDPISFSPAFQFIARTNLKIKDIDKISEEKLLLKFAIEEFLFHTTVDVENIKHAKNLSYKIESDFTESEQRKLIHALIRLKLGKLSPPKTHIVYPQTLKQFFLRLDKYQGEFDINLFDRESLDYLMEDLEADLEEEMVTISHIILNFIDKLNSSNILEVLSHSEFLNHQLILQSVKKVNV